MELKIGRFKPEYAGKMNFYLNLLDDFVREPHENPSIGIILCGERDNFEAEYALRDIKKPIGVSEFRLTRQLPKELDDLLPNPDRIEAEIRYALTLNPTLEFEDKIDEGLITKKAQRKTRNKKLAKQ